MSKNVFITYGKVDQKTAKRHNVLQATLRLKRQTFERGKALKQSDFLQVKKSNNP